IVWSAAETRTTTNGSARTVWAIASTQKLPISRSRRKNSLTATARMITSTASGDCSHQAFPRKLEVRQPVGDRRANYDGEEYDHEAELEAPQGDGGPLRRTQMNEFERLANGLLDLGSGPLSHLQGECDVLCDGHVREQ